MSYILYICIIYSLVFQFPAVPTEEGEIEDRGTLAANEQNPIESTEQIGNT